jgi:carbamoyltransferase
MRVLGISAYFHDSAAALVEDGHIIAAAQEERFSRKKHDASLPLKAVDFCLRQAGVSIAEVDQVVFYEKPLKKFERLLVSQLRAFPRGLGQFTRSMRSWLTDRLWVEQNLATALGCPTSKILFSDHHLSHAASAFLCSPFDSAAIVTVDGVGEWATTSIYRGVSDKAGSRIELIEELHFPHSIGLLYSAITAYLGFEVTMGASWGCGLRNAALPRGLRVAVPRGTQTPAQDRAALTLLRPPRDQELHARAGGELLGPARVPGAALELPAAPGSEAARFADVAASLQAFTERYLIALASAAAARTGEKRLALAGGVALNSVANRQILEHSPIEALFVQPAAGDAGGALGAALWAAHCLAKLPRGPAMHSALLGEAHSPAEVHRFLGDCAIDHRRFDDPGLLAEEVADRLARGEVGGWLSGRFEWGPRALGARSILADARAPDVKERVNRKIKLREPFRPFAPAVLKEESDRWFVPVAGKDDYTTAFMCSVAPATEEARRRLPAVVHVDGTSRLEVVEASSSPALHRLLLAFRAKTGVGVLLNTSFNLKDEPICSRRPKPIRPTSARSWISSCLKTASSRGG